ncbi:LuxR C-terminal-related transcriptional regulator [Roseibium sp.]|uniref:response regulator transcription factor n=1 Tax=Roseibium sp. TaxID=1936156 RepID=UPI003297BFC8
MLKVYVVDDDAMRRGRICRVFQTLSIHAEPFDSIEELLRFKPSQGCVLAHDGAEGIASLIKGLKQDNWLPVIGYGEAADTLRVVRAMQGGAVSYLQLPLQPDEFLREYEMLQRDFGHVFARNHRSASAKLILERLSEREREILVAMLDHGTSKVIARHLAISLRTVETHRANIMMKLKVRTLAQAIEIAVEGDILGIVRSPILTGFDTISVVYQPQRQQVTQIQDWMESAAA